MPPPFSRLPGSRPEPDAGEEARSTRNETRVWSSLLQGAGEARSLAAFEKGLAIYTDNGKIPCHIRQGFKEVLTPPARSRQGQRKPPPWLHVCPPRAFLTSASEASCPGCCGRRDAGLGGPGTCSVGAVPVCRLQPVAGVVAGRGCGPRSALPSVPWLFRTVTAVLLGGVFPAALETDPSARPDVLAGGSNPAKCTCLCRPRLASALG